MRGRDFWHYVFEVEDMDGEAVIEMAFEAGSASVRIRDANHYSLLLSPKLNRDNLLALTYVISKYVERVLTPEEIRALLRNPGEGVVECRE
ncbi:hypothetical protein [Thermococcus sp. MV11]|uniref:hypothetical protein n=1 Tax=Thermococcus sp. MV11 TaxID=1638267 RepID=UPI0014300992|nr:hypothetical protein [Thermococcus sp. MV11]NJE02969.1 hypothetical protein [Thermococcus sp. MV11]